MEFLEFTKKLLKIKQKSKFQKYSINPFKQNKQITLIWIDKNRG